MKSKYQNTSRILITMVLKPQKPSELPISLTKNSVKGFSGLDMHVNWWNHCLVMYKKKAKHLD